MKFSTLSLLFALLFSLVATAQNKEKSKENTSRNDNDLIQFSGVVLDQDSLTPIPFVSIIIKGTKRGAVTDFYGFFSMVIRPGDDLEFYSITHKPRTYHIPDTTRQRYFYAIQVLNKDTIELPAVEVYPWPSRDEFKRAFLALDLNDSDAERADRNLEREAMTYLERNNTPSASENHKYAMQAYYTKIYTAGQQPINNLLNPIKWAEFIESWRKGKFKGK